MYILGISAFYHDSAACILKDGEILAAAQEERFTRKKHDDSFPKHAIEFCLKAANIRSSDLEIAAFYDKPFLKFERILETYMAYAPRGFVSFIHAMPVWLKEKLWTKELISNELGGECKLIFPAHHESHAASAFYPSPFREAAILTVDGVGEWQTSTYGVGKGNKIDLLAETRFPHSLGLLYSAFTYYIGFKVNSGEYKLMGLAPYGEPIYEDLIRDELVCIAEDGSFRLNMRYFNYCTGLTMTNRRFNELFGGPPRKPETKITKRHMDIARSIQAVTQDIIYKMACHIHRETGMKDLCMAGGVALNCVANGLISKKGPYDRIWIQPASGDAGASLGASLIAWHSFLGNEREVRQDRDCQKASLLGPEYSDAAIMDLLDREKAVYEHLKREEIIERVSRLIGESKVVGWFQGRMEFGPRALGARSILADPRSQEMQSRLNLKIKFRESFRPFAPSVLEEKASQYFDLRQKSPYMLLVADVNENSRKKLSSSEKAAAGFDKLKAPHSILPATTHVDFSARVQTVSREDNPDFYDLIKSFYDKTGCAALINTSFNVRGEPIVCSPQDAYQCFMRTDMDYLVLENILLDKQKQPQSPGAKKTIRAYELD